MRKKVLRALGAIAVLGALIGLGIGQSACAAMGTAASGKRLERMEASPQWKDGKFDNDLERVQGSFGDIVGSWLGSDAVTAPAQMPPMTARKGSDYDLPPASGLRVTWLGHSTLLIEIDGQRVLVDPVWGQRASPVTWAGPERWYPPPLPLDELPSIDAVIISHDHYDHLDLPTIEQMLEVETTWLVPLGIGAHLEGWGIPASRIVELDWWDDRVVGDLTITCTPARHFSGRSFDANNTLWAGWAVKGPVHNVFYSGDTALHPAFKAIGEKLGPFDLTMMESGAYNPLWTDVHMGPEQAVIAHQFVRGKVMLPVHWGLFTLANHGWTEPIERILAAAKEVGVTVVAPRPGGWAEPSGGGFVDRWWDQEVPWQTVRQTPVWSTSIDDILNASPLFVPLAGEAAAPSRPVKSKE